MSATEEIARFVVDTGYEDIPGDAVEKAKRTALDCLGAALAGVVEPVSQTITGYERSSAGRLRHPSLAPVSRSRSQTLLWPTAPLRTLSITMIAV